MKTTKQIDRKIKELTNSKKGSYLNKLSRDIVNRTSVNTHRSIFFKAIGRNGKFLKLRLILKSGNGGLVYRKKAIEQFKDLVHKILDNQKQSIEEELEVDPSNFALVKTE